jgi:hypothetical protein
MSEISAEKVGSGFATVHSGKTGEFRFTIQVTSYSMSWLLSDAGSCSATIQISDELVGMNLQNRLKKWSTIICVYRNDGQLDGAMIVKDRKYDFKTHKLSITGADGWGLLSKRLVMNPTLVNNWQDGDVLIDEDNPRPDWKSIYTGSKPDIATKILQGTDSCGSWPYLYAPYTGGSNTKTYDNWSPKYIDDALTDLIKEQNGIEVLFMPELDYNTQRFKWKAQIADKVQLHTYQFVDGLPDNQWYFTDDSDIGGDIVNQVYGFGGKLDDKIVVARDTNDDTDPDMPLLQTVNTEHSTVSDVATLKRYMQGITQLGTESQDSIGIAYNRLRYNIAPGDVISVKFIDPYFGVGSRTLNLRVLSTDWNTSNIGTLAAREVIGD